MMCVLPTENIHINWADSIQFFLHPITNVEIVVANNFGSKNEFIEEIFFVVFREEPKLLAVKNCFERGVDTVYVVRFEPVETGPRGESVRRRRITFSASQK
jgi:hypothetical protein